MTAGSYPDDGLGEVFLKLGKQGSTLAGVMDAFSIAISIAPAVRRAARDLRPEVHQHALRAGRHDRRPGHPDGAVGDGLHLPPARAGLPAATRPAPSSVSSRRRSGPRWSRRRPTVRRRPSPRSTTKTSRSTSRPCAGAFRSSPGGTTRAGRGTVLDRADRGPAGHRGGCATVPELRGQDAPGRFAATSASPAGAPAAAASRGRDPRSARWLGRGARLTQPLPNECSLHAHGFGAWLIRPAISSDRRLEDLVVADLGQVLPDPPDGGVLGPVDAQVGGRPGVRSFFCSCSSIARNDASAPDQYRTKSPTRGTPRAASAPSKPAASTQPMMMSTALISAGRWVVRHDDSDAAAGWAR